MLARPTEIPGVLILEPRILADERGWFCEAYHAQKHAAAGVSLSFCQDNQAFSKHNVLRGLHYQIEQPQGKLVRVLRGAIFDVAVDLRRHSPTYGRWIGVELSSENRLQLFIPPQFAHGYQVLSETAEVFYKTSDFYAPAHERSIVWNDPTLGIAWPLQNPLLSPRDAAAPRFSEAPHFDCG